MRMWINYYNTSLQSINFAGVSIPFSLWFNDDKVPHFPFLFKRRCSGAACGIGVSKIS